LAAPLEQVRLWHDRGATCSSRIHDPSASVLIYGGVWYHQGAGGGTSVAVLSREIGAAIERLRAAFEPEEIILFGSRAYGQPRPDSDVDLLVVLRSAAEPLAARERRAREALGTDGWQLVHGHVWAFTPREMLRQLRRGDTAVRDALAKGEPLFPESRRSRYADMAREWSATGAKEDMLEKARDDMILADKALSPPVVPWGAAFHAQQAAEKALKALIYHLNGEPERTHRLSDLALRASELDARHGHALFLKYQARLADLEKHAVQPRYVNAPPVSEADALAAVETARRILEDIAALVGA
jgi:HEPN domain-containing protein/predicted nucleotidyltransferase